MLCLFRLPLTFSIRRYSSSLGTAALSLMLLACAGSRTGVKQDLVLHYCSEQSVCTEAKYSNNVITDYQVYNQNDNKVYRTGIRIAPGKYRSFQYYSTGAPKGEYILDSNLAARNTLAQYKLDGGSRIKVDTTGKDRWIKSTTDSVGNLISEAFYYKSIEVESKEYKDGQLVTHFTLTKTKSDTLLNTKPEVGARSVSEIMSVVNEVKPFLKKLYNAHLKHTSFDTRVTVHFDITPQGTVSNLFIVRFSGNPPTTFLLDIVTLLYLMEFKKISSGNTSVTIPFTMSRD